MIASIQLLLWPLLASVLYKIVLAIATTYRHAQAASKRGCKPPPTFPTQDPLGIIDVVRLIQSNNAGRLPEFLKERLDIMSRQEGRSVFTFQTHIARNWLLWTIDPKNIQALLATQFRDFELGPIRFGTFSPLLGNGIFSSDGKQWEHSRALLRPQFVRDQVSDLGLEERHVQNMLRALPVKSDGWTETIDLQPLNFNLTIDSASEFLLGESVNCQLSALAGKVDSLDAGSKANADFVAAFENSQDMIAKAFRLNDWYSLAITKEFRATSKVCHDYIDRIVEKRLNEQSEKRLEAGEKEKYVFLDKLAEATQDPIEIRDQVLSILVAGRDTTASLLGFLFLMLAEHQDVLRKLRETIIEEFGTYKSTDRITFSSLKSCQYLQWCMNETLRLFPTVPVNSRRSVRDTTIPRGGGPDGLSPVFVPKGTEVNYSVYAMHHNKDLWGPDAEEFKPERWNGKKPGFEYLPFNGGPRICLGQQFALTEAGYVTVRLLQRFDQFDNSAMDGLHHGWYLTLTGRPKYGVKLRMHAANED